MNNDNVDPARVRGGQQRERETEEKEVRRSSCSCRMRHINNNKSWSWKLGVLVCHPHPHPHHHHRRSRRRHLWKELLHAVFHCQMENERGVNETKEGEQSKTEREKKLVFSCHSVVVAVVVALQFYLASNQMRNETKPKNEDTSVEWTAACQLFNQPLTHSHAHTHTHTLTHFVIHPTELRSCWCRRKSLQRYYDKLGKKSSPESPTNYNIKWE